jgi:hypothetical protein
MTWLFWFVALPLAALALYMAHWLDKELWEQ